MAKLGEVCTIVSGSTPKTSVTSYWDGNIKWITPAELNEDTFYIMDSVRHITEEGKEKTGLSYLPTGTVILSSRAPIGKTAIAGCKMCCNQGFKNLICSDAIYNEYLYFFLKSKTDYLNSLGRGATFKEISKSIVENIEIPLPEVNQQKEIAEKFKKLEQLISLRKQQLAKLDELVKARFVEMFETRKYPIEKLGRVCEKITDGTHKTPTYLDSGIKFISAKNIIDGKVDLTDTKYISKNEYQEIQKRCQVEIQDILLTKSGTLGIPAIIRTDCALGLFESLAVIKYDRSKLLPYFLYEQLRCNRVQRQFKAGTKGVAVKHLHLGVISDIDIIVPPISYQLEFSDFAEQVDKQKQTVQQSLDKLELMKKALMQEYFG